jgi:D-alanine-D-alanine ligase
MNIGLIYNSFSYKDLLPEELEMRETGLAIGKHLVQFGYTVQYFDMDDPESIEELCRSNIDVAFDTCERIHGDSRGEAYVAALLEYLDIPHTRTSSWLISLGISKERVKSILSYNGIATPPYQIFYKVDEELNSELVYPLFVKGLLSENSIGIDEHSLVNNDDELRSKVKQITTQLLQPALVEEYINGREFTVAILPGEKNLALPISEITFKDLPENRRFQDYSSKWYDDSEQYKKTIPQCPAHLTPEEQRSISEAAMQCYNILGLDSYARVDIRYRDGISYILEVNQNPSIGEKDCGYVRTCISYGLDYVSMLNSLLMNAVLRKNENRTSRTILTKPNRISQNQQDSYLVETARV